MYVSSSKDHLCLHPHRTDAAVREIAIQEASCQHVIDILLRHLDELRMIESIECLPAQLQAPGLTEWNRFGQIEVEVVGTTCVQRVSAHGSSVGEPGSFNPMHIGGGDARERIGILIASCTARKN